jgi:hypothetical protein
MSVVYYGSERVESLLRDFCAAGLHRLLTEDPEFSSPVDYRLRAACHFDRLALANCFAYAYQYREDINPYRVDLDANTLTDAEAPINDVREALRGYFGLWYNVFDNNGNVFLGGRDQHFHDRVMDFVRQRFGSVDAFYRGDR